MTEHELDFDSLCPADFHFKSRGVSYVLREPSEAAKIAFTAKQMKEVKMVDGKVSATISENVADSQSILVAACLFTKNKDGVDVPVSLAAVRVFPARVVKELFDRAKEMGHIGEEETVEELEKQIAKLAKRRDELNNKDAAKNSPPAGTDTSA